MVWAAVLCGLLLWPLTRGGYLLGHDMVFTPRQPLDLAGIGLSSASPRAVPLDALVALAERIGDGALVGRLAVVVPVLAAGLGAAALLRARGVAAGLATCGFAIWNPYVVERLALGQWALLWCYASLPWLLLLIARFRGTRSWVLLALAGAAASITPTGGLIAAVVAVAVAVAVHRTGRDIAVIAVGAVVLQLPWLVPSLVSTAAATSDPRAVAAFASRSEFAGGTLLSLLGGGGIWDADVVPGTRSGALPWIGLVVLIAATGYGARHLAVLVGTRLRRALVVLAGAGLFVAIAPSLPGSVVFVGALVAHVPGAGLLRDAQKWIMPLVLMAALLVGAAVDRLAGRLRSLNWRIVVLVTAASLPLLLLPDGATVVRATVEPVHYPHDWSIVVARARGGTATVVPYSSYRRYTWAPGRASVLDPAPRLLAVGTVVQDRLSVSGRLLHGEDPRAADVARALQAGTTLPVRLAVLGIRWVVVERDTPGTVPALTGLAAVYRGRHVALYRVPGAIVEPGVAGWRTALVVAADAFAVLLLLSAAVIAAGARIRRRCSALL